MEKREGVKLSHAQPLSPPLAPVEVTTNILACLCQPLKLVALEKALAIFLQSY